MAKERFTSPVLRLVQGDAHEAQTKDQQGNPLVAKTGPNAGRPTQQYFIAGAIAKSDPAWPAFWALLAKAAVDGFPNLFPQGIGPVIAAGGPTLPAGVCVHPQFSFKVIDGDGFDTNGKRNDEKEGFKGCWIIRFASSYAPRCFHKDRYAPQEQIQDKAIKRGHFIRVCGTTEGNDNTQRPGIYANLDMVELFAYGPEIVTGPSAADAFGGSAPALPPGASATPVTPGNAAAPPSHAAGSPAAGSAAPPPAQGYDGYMQGNGAAAAAPPPAPPAAPPPPAATASPGEPQLTAKGAGQTYGSMIAAGWTDAQLREHGYLV